MYGSSLQPNSRMLNKMAMLASFECLTTKAIR